MTSICAIETDRGVVMGGDSLISYADDLSFVFPSEVEKVWRTNSTVMGVAGSCRILQVFKHYLVIPDLDRDEELIEDWMVHDCVDAMRRALKQAGNGNGDDPWTALLGIGSMLWMIDGGFGVHRCSDGLMACGSGSPYLMGSLYTTSQFNIAAEELGTLDPISPTVRIHFALASAARYSSGSMEPFIIYDNYPWLQLYKGEPDADQ